MILRVTILTMLVGYYKLSPMLVDLGWVEFETRISQNLSQQNVILLTDRRMTMRKGGYCRVSLSVAR